MRSFLQDDFRSDIPMELDALEMLQVIVETAVNNEAVVETLPASNEKVLGMVPRIKCAAFRSPVTSGLVVRLRPCPDFSLDSDEDEEDDGDAEEHMEEDEDEDEDEEEDDDDDDGDNEEEDDEEEER